MPLPILFERKGHDGTLNSFYDVRRCSRYVRTAVRKDHRACGPGSGGGYGFETITDIGMMMEKAAKEGRNEEIRLQMKRLEDYLQRVEIVYD